MPIRAEAGSNVLLQREGPVELGVDGVSLCMLHGTYVMQRCCSTRSVICETGDVVEVEGVGARGRGV